MLHTQCTYLFIFSSIFYTNNGKPKGRLRDILLGAIYYHPQLKCIALYSRSLARILTTRRHLGASQQF